MDREGFRNRLKQYKEARGLNPLLKYWEWKETPKYEEGTGNVGENNNTTVPTPTEYITSKIQLKIAEALQKSRTRNLPAIPFKGTVLSEKEWNNHLNLREQEIINSKLPASIKALSLASIRAERAEGYQNYLGSNSIGPTCARTTGDNYGIDCMVGSEQFRQNYKDWGFQKIDNSDVLPGDVVIDVKDGKGSHTMMLDSGTPTTGMRFNHSNGGYFKENIRHAAKYPFKGEMESYTYVGTPADSTQWENEYKKLYGYAEGGEVTDPQVEVLPKEQWPSPEEMYEQVRLPFNDLPLENVFSPLDIALGTAYKAWPMVNNVFKNYGPTLGALMVGSDGTNMNKPLQQMLTKKLDPDVKEFYNDIVIPLNPNDKKYKQYFINLFGDIDIQIDPTSNMPVNFAADFNPITNDIRLNSNYIQTPMQQLLEAHEYGHLVDKYLPHKASTQQELNQSLPVSKKPISKDSDTYRERQSTKREAEFKTFKKLKDAGKLQLKTARAKTKKYQEYLMNATDEEILELLGADTAYKKDYLAGNLDIDTLRKQMIYAPTIAAGIIIPTHLLDSDKKENA